MKKTATELLAELIEAEARYAKAVAAYRRKETTNFREFRMKLGLTQRDLADRLGVSHTYISKIENGHQEAGIPILSNIHRLLSGGTA